MSDKHTLAFPATTEHGLNSGVSGMTLRDYFAAKAMQGNIMDEAILGKSTDSKGWIEKIAMASYEMADAMLEARKS